MKKATRKLTLRRETLAELAPDDLRAVVAGDWPVTTTCRITVLQAGCVSDPRICHYDTDFC